MLVSKERISCKLIPTKRARASAFELVGGAQVVSGGLRNRSNAAVYKTNIERVEHGNIWKHL